MQITISRLWGVQDVAEYLGVPIKTLYDGGGTAAVRGVGEWVSTCVTTLNMSAHGSSHSTVMARPPLPIGTAGRVKLAQEGLRKWRATCQFRDSDGEIRKVSRWEETKARAENKLREDIRDRQVQGTDISSDTKVPKVYAQWLAELRALADLGNRSGTSADTYENRWNKLLLSRVKSLRISGAHGGAH